ncbi:MAG: hypothetical protein ABIJ31_16920 [Pseudomonadota bacterium]
MKPEVIIKSITAAFLILILNCAMAGATATIEKKFILHPGWNSIFLDVQPSPADPFLVFASLPKGSSVWTWMNKNSSVEFISNPNEDLLKIPGWCVFFQDDEKSFLNNLYAIIAGWAYLINVAGDQPVELAVTGMASVKKTTWIPDSFNLTGFNVNSDNPPDFATFFSASPAHTGQAIYTLNPTTGMWNFIENLSATKIKAGEAYWVYCEGASEYQGPLEITLPGLGGFDYGKYNDTLIITFHNAFDQAVLVNMSPLSNDIALVYRKLNTETGLFEWPPLSSMPAFSLVPNSWKNIRVSALRESLVSEKAQSLVRIWDNLGNQLIVPVLIEKETL